MRRDGVCRGGMGRGGMGRAVRGVVVRTTMGEAATPCPLDRVNRRFNPPRPNPFCVSGFTYVSTWQGRLCVAFVVDVFARRIVCWWVSSSMDADVVRDPLNQVLCDRRPEREDAPIHHGDRGGASKDATTEGRNASRSATANN